MLDSRLVSCHLRIFIVFHANLLFVKFGMPFPIPASQNSKLASYILRATPSAAGPRSLLIASGLQILGIVASGSYYFWDANFTVRSRLGFYRIFVDLEDPFKQIFGYVWIEKHGFFISNSRLLFLLIFGSESGCLGLENQAFGKGGIAKINFRINWISFDSRVHFE